MRSPRPSCRKCQPVAMSIIIGRCSGRPGNGSVGTNMRRSGCTGKSTPAMRAIPAAQGPAAFTTTGAETPPFDVSTPDTAAWSV